MIYQLDYDFLDLKKLEHISCIGSTKTKYNFRYQINGYVYDSDSHENYEIIVNKRKALLEAWTEYKESL